MKFGFSSPTALVLLAAVGLSSAVNVVLSTNPKVEGSASFPPSNPFGHVVNGEDNKISVLIENKSDVEIDIVSVSGSLKEPSSEKLIRNTTALSYQGSVPIGSKITIPYSFYSEFKPQDTRLQIFVDYLSGGQPFRVQVYDSVVSIVEPAASIFDLQMILTYILLLGTLGGGAYLAFLSFFPQTKRTKSASSTTTVKAAAPVAATSGYEEEWIPEHHLKSRKSKGNTSGAASSGDESAPEKKSKGKGKKRA